MSAFGPYAHEVTVDFERLGREGIYLVCGDTGAGKTTIFDAISYALFGRTSGAGRDARELRSQFATIDDPTFVELAFSYRGKRYVVRRNPDYPRRDRRSKDGEKTAMEGRAAELHMPDGSVITQLNAVTEAIQDLLGITVEQFSQICMIAQGDFRRLLSASTEDRGAIFRQLFGTERLRYLQVALDQRAKELYATCASHRTTLATHASQAVFAPGSEAEAWREEALRGVESERVALDPQALAGRLETAVGQDQQASDELSRQLESAEGEIADLTRRHQSAQDRAKTALQAQQIRDRLPGLDARASQSAEALKDALADEPRETELRQAAMRLHDELPRYERRTQARAALDDAAQGERVADEALRELEQELSERASRLEGLRGQLAGEPAAIEALAEARQAREQAERRRDDARAQVQQHERLSALLEQEKEAERRSSLNRERAAACERQIEALDVRWRQTQATRDNLADAGARAAQARAASAAAREELDRLKSLRESLARLAADEQYAKGELTTRQAAYLKAQAESEQAQKAYALAQRAYLDGQAGVLARDLVPGRPCPVCGSLEHPSPAPSEAGAPAREDVERAQALWEKASERAKNAAGQASSARATLAERSSAREKFELESGDDEGLRQAALEADGRLARAEAALGEAERDQYALELTSREAARVEGLRAQAASRQRALDQDASNIASDLAAIGARLDAQRKELTLTDEREARDELAAAEAALKTATGTQAEAQRHRDNLDIVRSAAEQLEDCVKKLTAKREAKAQALAEAQQEKAAAQASLRRIEEERLTCSDAEEAQRRIASLQREARSIAEKLEEARRADRDAREAVADARGRLDGLEDRLSAETAEDPAELAALLEHARAQKDGLSNDRSAVDARLATNRRVLDKVKALDGKAGADARAYTRAKNLADTANGRLPGKAKVDFETFAQMRYLDEVLAAANRRLSMMTGGRFELARRPVDESGRRGKSGLDLNVFDNYTGQARSSTTLSGGESFKASLSLALGLSDVVQAQAGGIQLDTMFVDEGFGTLDDESLQLAVKTLTELTGGGKLVGIISHVDELKQSIDRQIVVTRGREGSSLRVVC